MGEERTPPDDILLGKVDLIERSVARVREVHAGNDETLKSDTLPHDSILLNLQRACESSIDLALHLVRVHRLGIPKDSRDAFGLLEEAGMVPPELSERLKRMVGFRNVAVHAYVSVDPEIVKAIIHERLDDLLTFTRLALRV